MTPHRKPSVCFVSTGLARGGAEAQLFRTAVGLRQCGHDVQVINMLTSDYYADRLAEHGIPVVCLNASPETGAPRILARFLRTLRGRGAGVLAGFDYPGSMLARVGGAVARVPVVISSIRSENLGTNARRLVMRWTDSLATVTTTNSRRVANKLVACGAASLDRLRVIPNGLDVTAVGPHLREQRQALRTSLGVPDTEFLWVAAGTLNAAKDYPNLLNAVSRATANGSRFRLAIAGDGPLREDLVAQVTSAGLDRTVSFLGLRDDVTTCMAAADGFVLSSAWEGLPNAVLEALAVGTPVVATDVGGMRELVADGVSGLIVPPRDSNALAEAMSSLMGQPVETRRRMGDEGRRHVAHEFALDRIVGSWSDLITELSGARA